MWQRGQPASVMRRRHAPTGEELMQSLVNRSSAGQPSVRSPLRPVSRSFCHRGAGAVCPASGNFTPPAAASNTLVAADARARHHAALFMEIFSQRTDGRTERHRSFLGSLVVAVVVVVVYC